MKYLNSQDTDFHLEIINPVYRQSVRDLEVVLTKLWMKLEHENRTLRPNRPLSLSMELAQGFIYSSDSPFGFPDVASADAWLRSEALVMLKGTSRRRRVGEFVVARPVHYLATRVRNSSSASYDWGTSDVAYGWLHRAPRVMEQIDAFLNVGIDDSRTDLTTYALALLGDSVGSDKEQSEPQAPPTPMCGRLGRQYAEDMSRLLAYEGVLPRIALVEHMARLTGLYVGLFLLTNFRAVTELERGAGQPTCAGCGDLGYDNTCEFRIELFVDCSDQVPSPSAVIAEDSWRDHEDSLLSYLTSHVRLKKFHEFAERNNQNELREPIPIQDISSLCRSSADPVHRANLVDWATDRIREMGRTVPEIDRPRLDELRESFALSGDGFDVYVSLILHSWMGKWHNYYLQVLDYVFAGAKNDDGLVRQPRGGRRPRRRAVLNPLIVETLCLLILLRKEGDNWKPRFMRVDEVVDEIATRYGLLIDRLPGSRSADPSIAAALHTNLHNFKLRLREAGLFRDLSDAYLAQIVTPRFQHLGGEHV